MNRQLACLLTAVLLAAPLQAQWQPPRPLVPTPSPLFFVRFSGPPGMKATFYQGTAVPREFPCPVVVGMRAGYVFRVRLSDLPGHPGLTLYPSIEVRGSLKLQPRYSAASFPATVKLTERDIEAAKAGVLVTKAIYLEHPDRAEPTASAPGDILETDVPLQSNLLEEARRRGRVLLVVYLGGRIPVAEEIAMQNVPGTILFPGEKMVGPAAAPPKVLPVNPGFYDPFLGPRPLEEECLHDGGDRLQKAAFDGQGQLAGVDPEDTVAEYRDSAGRRQVVCSNRVCLCVPRYAALVKQMPLTGVDAVLTPMAKQLVKRDVTLTRREESLTTNQVKKPVEAEGRMRPSENVALKSPGQLVQVKMLQADQLTLGPVEAVGTKRILQLSPAQKLVLLKQLKLPWEFSGVQRLGQYDQLKGPAVIARVKGGPEIITATVTTRDLTVCCNEAPIPPECPLVLIKCADRGSAQVGDVVTFSLRYSNVGGRPMTDVAVVDSLSGRLEYVEGSAQSDRDAVFTVQPNEAGSQLLRWEVTGTLQPGDSGRVRFQARIR